MQPYECLFVLECQINSYQLQINKSPEQGNESDSILHLLFILDINWGQMYGQRINAMVTQSLYNLYSSTINDDMLFMMIIFHKFAMCSILRKASWFKGLYHVENMIL